MDLYRDTIIELYKNPINKGIMPDAHLTASGANITCGDRIRIYVKLSPDGSTVADCSFEAEGCAISIAAASLMTEETRGKALVEVAQWSSLHIFEWLGVELGPLRIKCGLLCLETLQEGLKIGRTQKSNPH